MKKFLFFLLNLQEIKNKQTKSVVSISSIKIGQKKKPTTLRGKNNFARKKRKYSALCKMKFFFGKNQSCKNCLHTHCASTPNISL